MANDTCNKIYRYAVRENLQHNYVYEIKEFKYTKHNKELIEVDEELPFTTNEESSSPSKIRKRPLMVNLELDRLMSYNIMVNDKESEHSDVMINHECRVFMIYTFNNDHDQNIEILKLQLINSIKRDIKSLYERIEIKEANILKLLPTNNNSNIEEV